MQTVKTPPKDAGRTKTDWARLHRMTDAEIAQAAADDPDAAPIPTREQLEDYKPSPGRAKR